MYSLEVTKFIAETTNWQNINGALERHFQFPDFSKALAFLVQVGILCEKVNHHAEIWNVYNQVKLRLHTHDQNTITEKDIDLAKEIDKL